MNGTGNSNRGQLWPYVSFIVALGISSSLVASSFFEAVVADGLSAESVPAYSVALTAIIVLIGVVLSVILSRTVSHDVETVVEEMERRTTDAERQVADAERQVADAERQVADAERQVVDMAQIAYHDPLTHVKSQAAYEEYVGGLEDQIGAASPSFRPRFSVVMVDVNNLKTINDTYGHEVGNEYLVSSCHLLCRTLAHSPVFRIGGDEFVAILTGEDYSHRRQLVGCLEDAVRRSITEEDLEPWQRHSMAIGMATYYQSNDTCYQDVFERADRRMYQNKVGLKERYGLGDR